MTEVYWQPEEKWLDKHALEIVERLQSCNFTSYLVGGCVRDLLAGVHPKDFDIVTNAHPNQVKKQIRQAYVIGKRFRLVLVYREKQQYEVATFRRNPTIEEKNDTDLQGDNLFGNPEEDAARRDFTVNALFYDSVEGKLIDYVGGLDDIEMRVIRMIGDPSLRLIEDPIRIIRAIRLSHKLNFEIEPELRKELKDKAPYLKDSALPRRREDLLKILRLKDTHRCLLDMYDLGVIEAIYPSLLPIFEDEDATDTFIEYIKYIPFSKIDKSDPKHLFTLFVYAFIKASCSDWIDCIEKWTSDNNYKLDNALKNEFGLFNAEIECVKKAIVTLPILLESESFARRGAKRKINFLGNESFILALQIAKNEKILSAQELYYWTTEFDKALPEIHKKENEIEIKKKKAKKKKYQKQAKKP